MNGKAFAAPFEKKLISAIHAFRACSVGYSTAAVAAVTLTARLLGIYRPDMAMYCIGLVLGRNHGHVRFLVRPPAYKQQAISPFTPY